MKNSLKTVAALAILLNAASVRAQLVFGGAGRAATAGGATAAAWFAAMPAIDATLGLGSGPNLLQANALSGLLADTPLTPAGLAALPPEAAKAQVRDALAVRVAPILLAGANAAAKDGAGSKRFESALSAVQDLRLVANLLPNEQFVLVERQGAELERIMVARHHGAGKAAKQEARRMAEALDAMSRTAEAAVVQDFTAEPGRDAAKAAFLRGHALKPSSPEAAAPRSAPSSIDSAPAAAPAGATDAEFAKAVKTFLRIAGGVVAAAGAWIAAGMLGFVDPKAGIEFLAVYGVELSLSADNLVAFAAILAPVALKLSPKTALNILKVGLWGALGLRIAASFFGLHLIASYGSLAMLGGGAVLVLLAMKILLPEKYSPLAIAGGAVSRLLAPVSRLFDAIKKLIGGSSARKGAAAGVLFGALIAVAFTDITFAVDSIPTALGLTKNLGVIVLANVASVLGLSQLYVILNKMADRFHLVNKGVGVALAVVAAKMILEAMHLWHLALLPSVAIVMAPIVLALALSPFIRPAAQEHEA